MGILSFIKNELIDIIEWTDDSGDILVWRFPDQNHDIKMGAKLTVREGQAVVFLNEGQIADVFSPGLYTLNTQNLPVLTTLRSWKYGFESPFKADVYFVNTRNFLDRKWGTQNPIMMRDPEFGAVRLRAFGTYGIRVTDPAAFMRQVVGTDGCFTTDEIEGQLRSMIVSSFSGMLAKSKIAALDLASNYRTMGDSSREAMNPDIQSYGLTITAFVIENISLPPEVEKMLDIRSQMGIVGDMGRFTQFQTAASIPEAAKSGGAGEFMGMGAGIAMGQRMAQSMAASFSPTETPQAQPTPAAAPVEQTKTCSQCGKPTPENAKFCSECGAPQEISCPQCKAKVKAGTKFCSECGQKLA